jgi:hypothetical protein
MARNTTDYIKLLYIVYGWTYELETLLLLSGEPGYLRKNLSEFQNVIVEIQRMLKNKHLAP